MKKFGILNKITSTVRLLVFLPLLIVFFFLVLLSSFFGIEGAHFILQITLSPLFGYFFSLEIEGQEHLKANKGLILVGNHTSILDTATIEIASKKPVTFVMSDWIQNIAIIGLLSKNFRVIPVPGRYLRPTLNNAIERLLSGESICIFPEGKVTLDGNLCEFKKGAAYLHQRSKKPIIPFVIHGCFEAWPWKICLPKFRKITIKFGAPYYNPNEHREVVTNQVKSIIQEMKEFLDEREG